MRTVEYYFQRFKNRIYEEKKDNWLFLTGKTDYKKANIFLDIGNVSNNHFRNLSKFKNKNYKQLYKIISKYNIEKLYFLYQVVQKEYSDYLRRYFYNVKCEKITPCYQSELYINELEIQKKELDKAEQKYKKQFLDILVKSIEIFVNESSNY